MRTAAGWLTEDRTRRSVRRATLRIPSGAPRHRLAAAMEEALRLAALPGEEQGRVYYFRRLQVLDLPLSGGRRDWLEVFQRALLESAASAVHGADSRADASPAVFFRSRQEALEILLHRILDRRTAAAWFWPMVLRGQESGGSPLASVPTTAAGEPPAPAYGTPAVPAIIEMLGATEPSWVAVAAALFAAARLDTARLFDAVTASVAEGWVAEMGSEPAVTAAAADARARVSARALRSIREAAQLVGIEDPRTVWLAALAVLEESPSELASGTAVQRARAILRNLASRLESRTESREHTRALIPADAEPAGDSPAPVLEGDPSAVREAPPVPDAPALLSAAAPHPWFAEGMPTRCGGLFFLLNPMWRLGIEAEVSAPDFISRLLERLAAYAGADPEDPIVIWLASLHSEVCEPQVERSLRSWAVAVRRWCWRTGGITAREVILRNGVFNVNRTDLNVSLPLDEADVRIRRIGLDHDPGWLPWFGRVVRFHYVYREGIHG